MLKFFNKVLVQDAWRGTWMRCRVINLTKALNLTAVTRNEDAVTVHRLDPGPVIFTFGLKAVTPVTGNQSIPGS